MHTDFNLQTSLKFYSANLIILLLLERCERVAYSICGKRDSIKTKFLLILLAIVDPDGNQTIFSRAVGRNQHPARLRERTLS